MTIIAYILLFVLAFKCVFNLTIPYMLLRRKEGVGISAMPYLDFVLLALVVATSFAADGTSWTSQPKIVASVAGALIVGSYLHFVIVMVVGGWFLSKRKS